MADELGGVGLQGTVVGLPDLHCIVSDDPVSALDELDGHLALAHAGLPLDEHALAVDLHHHAGAGDAGGQIVIKAADEGAHKGRGLGLGAQHRPPMGLGGLQTLGKGHQPPGDDQAGDGILQQPFKALPALLCRHPRHKGGLCQAHQQQALGVKMLEKPGQGQAGPVHVHRVQGYLFIIGGGA